MKRLVGLLLVLSVLTGCGDKSTGPSTESRVETYPDGSTRAEYSFYVDKTTQDQVKHGPYILYYKDGQIQSEGT